MSIFSLSRFSDGHADPIVVPEGVGSSLMSEKGYDSDAQCISTPKQQVPVIGHPNTASNTQPYMSSLRNAYQGKLNDRKDQQLSSEKIANLADEQHLGHGEISTSQLSLACPVPTSPQPHDSVLDLSCVTHRVSSPLPNATNFSVHNRAVEPSRPFSMSEKSGSTAGNGRGITPPWSLNGGKNRFYATVARQGLHVANQPNVAQVSYGRSSESLDGISSEIMFTKTRQQHSRESSSELRSVHLGDMNIPQVLAPSTSTSSRILSENPSVDEDGQANVYSTRSFSDQYHDCVGQGRAHTPSWGNNGLGSKPGHRRDASSFYSPKSSIASAEMPTDFHFPGLDARVNSPLGSAQEVSTNDAPAASVADTLKHDPNKTADRIAMDSPNTDSNEPDLQTDALKSKFVEQFGINKPVSFSRSLSNGSIDQQDLPPRKVSVGWMSGGRRLGYGYTLVSENEDRDQEIGTKSNPTVGSENQGEGERNGDELENTTRSSNREFTGKDHRRQSSSSNRDVQGSGSLSPRHFSGATTLIRATRASESTDASSGGSSFWERLLSRGNDQIGTGKLAAFRDRFKSSETEQYPKRSLWLENENRGVLDRWTEMRFPLSSETDQCDTVKDEHESVVQSDSDMNQIGSLPRKRTRAKFRVLNRGRRRSNASHRPIFPVKRSHRSETSDYDSNPRVYYRYSDPESDQHYREHIRRFRPNDGQDDWAFADRGSLEMHSEPE